jgi:predicted metal-dependent peptidase
VVVDYHHYLILGDIMNQKIKNLAKKAKLKLFTKDLMFFGLQSYKFEWSFEDPGHENAEGWVLFSKDDPDHLEAGTIHFNERIVSKDDYTYNHLCYLNCHELLHILNKHGSRRGNRRNDVWCVACDHVVETELKHMSNVIKPWNNQYNIIPEITKAIPNCSAEKAYNWLLQNKQFASRISQNPETGQIEVKDQNGEVMFTVSPMQGGSDEKGKIEPQTVQQVEQFVSEARAMFTDMKKKGTISGSISEHLDKILKVEIPWDELLEKAIKTNVVLKPDGRSWRNINKYYVGIGLTLPGYSLEETNEGVGTLIICADTSGSVSKKQLKQFSYVIEKSMTYFERVVLLVHDVQIHQEKEFSKDNILEFYNFISKEGYKGRGGTSHKYVFDKIEEMWENDMDDISMCISLTDAYSDIEHLYKNYKFIKNNTPLVFILTDDGKIMTLEKDYGEITQIQIK